MADRKEIEVGLNASGMRSGAADMLSEFDKLKQRTQELSKLTGDAYKKEQEDLKNIIALLDKKNRLEYEYKTTALKTEFRSDIRSIQPNSPYLEGRAPEQARRETFDIYKGQMVGAAGDFQQQREQTKLLRELIDTVKQGNKDQIREE